MTECLTFLDQWTTDPANLKPVFETLKQALEAIEAADISFKARPGITYSLRGAIPGNERDLFTMVDVVDDDPNDRWLSVCFFDDQITDPEELGDWVPEGLAGKDARCFDITDNEPALTEYVRQRIVEASEA